MTQPMTLFPRLAISALVLVASATAGFATSTTVSTDPVGFTTGTAVGQTNGAVYGLSYLSPDLTRPVDYAGIIPTNGVSSSGTAGSTLTFSAGTFTGLTFTGTGNSHYIEITSGSGAGAMSAIVDSDNDHVITLADDLSAIIDNSGGTTTFKTRPHWTLATLFGGTNSAGFQAGTSASQADTISVFSPGTGAYDTYYFHSTHNRWQKGASDATNAIIPPDRGFLVERILQTSLAFVIQGSVKTGTTGVYITGGTGGIGGQYNNFVCQPYPMNSVTLANSGLFTNNVNTGVQAGTSSSSADTVNIFNPATQSYSTYYYHSTHNRWQQGASDASSVMIPDGASVLITRKTGNPSFTWYVPQPPIAQ